MALVSSRRGKLCPAVKAGPKPAKREAPEHDGRVLGLDVDEGSAPLRDGGDRRGGAVGLSLLEREELRAEDSLSPQRQEPPERPEARSARVVRLARAEAGVVDGAVPCVASKMAAFSPMLAPGAIPKPPTIAAAASEM